MGHRFVRQPLLAVGAVSGIDDAKHHSRTMSQMVDILYDDLSRDRMLVTQERDRLSG